MGTACDNCLVVANPDQADCDSNGIGDACAILSGRTPDCDGGGVPDFCEIALGQKLDADDDGIPDVCQTEPACGEGKLIGDGNGDGIVDGADYTLWADNFGIQGPTFETGDFNCDGFVDGADYTLWADNFGATLGGGAGAGATETVEEERAAAESVPICGLGGEFALLLWPLFALSLRRHSRGSRAGAILAAAPRRRVC